jgi:glycosyltransferase involved in cell wall biosynthesis
MPHAHQSSPRATRQPDAPQRPPVVRADLHCHSVASTEADEAVLNAIQCPECYSEPAQVYAQAKRRGMTFVTITDHDSIDGVGRLAGREDVLVGEEVTCYFPEDRCKMHVLVWGLGRADHDALQARADDIYAVAEYVERQNLAHAVAHPVYRQNDKLERWHLERLFVMFKGFECLNGSHSMLHRDSFEPMLDELTPASLAELSSRHALPIRWGAEAWRKTRTGGSDDHGLFNVGRTWTEFPADVRTPAGVLQALRDGRCRPGGEAGSSLKLAHNFYGVGIRYFIRNLTPAGETSLVAPLLEALVGDRRMPRRRELAATAIKHRLRAAGRRVLNPFRRRPRPPTGAALLQALFARSINSRDGERQPLHDAARRGEAPLGEHDAAFRLFSGVNRDIGNGIAAAIRHAVTRRELAPIFDSLSAIAAHQCVQLPYYFALFHQNRERPLLRGITGWQRARRGEDLRVGLFTDTVDGGGDVSRFVRTMASRAAAEGKQLTVVTTGAGADPLPNHKDFEPLVSRAQLAPNSHWPLALPPVAEVLEWADRVQFDAVHVATAGPMGLCGWLVAKMLHVPVVMTHHVDVADAVHAATGDFRLTAASSAFGRWWVQQASRVLVRSRAARAKLSSAHGVKEAALLATGVDAETFTPTRRDPSLWRSLGVHEPIRLLYRPDAADVTGARLLAAAYRKLCACRLDAALVVVGGEGPSLPLLRRELSGLPARFVAEPAEADLPRYFASADLLLCPTGNEAPPQRVVEAQACGLPSVVNAAGGPAEAVDDGLTGLVLPSGATASQWAEAIQLLLCDEPRRLRMARTAPTRVARFAGNDPFAEFWDAHVRLVLPSHASSAASAANAPGLDHAQLLTTGSAIE